MATLLSIFLIGLVVFMVDVSTTSQWVDGRRHSENTATAWKNGGTSLGYGQELNEANREQAIIWKNGRIQPGNDQWPREANREQSIIWKNRATQGNRGDLQNLAENWRNENIQPENGDQPRRNEWQVQQQAGQWQMGAGMNGY